MHEARKPAVKVSCNRAPVFDPRSSKRTSETFREGEGISFEINRKSVKRVVVSCTNNGSWNLVGLKSIEKAIIGRVIVDFRGGKLEGRGRALER